MRLLLRFLALRWLTESVRWHLVTGWNAMRDRSVPVGAKVGALGAGLLLSFGIQLVEIPPELALAALLPGLGVPVVITWNGFENLVLPILLAFGVLAQRERRQALLRPAYVTDPRDR